jgi:hypothetical protein
MTNATTLYPAPDRSDHAPQANARRQFSPELDISSAPVVYDDGRPVLVERWFDMEMELAAKTFWYSREGIEEWSEEDHYAYVERNGGLKGKTYPDRGAGIQQLDDASGRPVWSVTVVMWRDPD